MTKDYLLEVGMEEIPARFLLSLSNQLQERVGTFLDEHRITYDTIKAYATPRRLAVIVRGLAEKQSDLSEKVKGPALRIAQDAEGNWSKAAQGFVRGQGLTVDDIIVEAVKEEDYIFVDKFIAGQDVATVLEDVVEVLNSMTFPISMTWHTYHKAYIRPVHWLVSLLDDQVVPFTFVEVEASNVSRGHRFLGDEVTIANVNTYESQLKDESVIVDFETRQATIKAQIEAIAEAQTWHIPIDDDLLEEVTSIVEWPTAFYGDFDESYLEVPSIVLITAMRDHQRYFYAEQPDTGELLPIFISVRNGNAEHIDNVIKGNKKVLWARLEDALFFYQDDKQHNIDFFVEKLAHVKEHFKLGSLADKQERVQALIEKLSHLLGEKDQAAVAIEAAKIYKFDLMTQIVNEFDELQGQMGELYALEAGLDEAVAKAIGEQYLPTSSGGVLPETIPGSLLAFADKLDTLVNYFKIDLIPTGSNDPFALRRQAMGLVEITLNNNWSIDFREVIHGMIDESEANIANQLVDFIGARIQQYLERIHIDHDIIQAVIHSRVLNPVRIVAFAKELQALKESKATTYRELVEALSRVVNLGIKETEASEINPSLSETTSETELITYVTEKLTLQTEAPLAIFIELTKPISVYFENNMVNSDNSEIRANRLATMKTLTDFILQTMDPRELISKF